MGIFILLLCGLIVYGISFGSFQNDYLEKDQCTVIKGIFAVIVFLSHARGYLKLGEGVLNRLFVLVLYVTGQSMVSMFFFYSGYGVLLSYLKKKDYAKHFFKKRLIKTLVHFDLAVCLYALLNTCLGRVYSLKTYLLSMTGLVSIGNSNWFIFVILALYGITLVSFLLMKQFHIEKKENVSYTVTGLSLALWLLLYAMGFSGYWFNTLLCYQAGMLFAANKNRITAFMRDGKKYWLATATVIVMMLACYVFRGNNVTYSIFSILFAIMIVFITMKVRIHNQALLWLGKYSFSVYILQRIPMMLLSYFGFNNAILFTLAAWICTLFMAYCFEIVLKYVDQNVLHC